ncbi:MAG: hypothetical protein AB8B86_16380 [Pseudomonadales bacterium]
MSKSETTASYRPQQAQCLPYLDAEFQVPRPLAFQASRASTLLAVAALMPA